jgi:23S rRNA (cytidine1920-2'-O)/16S rRNA (cytidine1409-2'-O)-methyltransferase
VKKRVDVLLVERGLAESRTQAQALLLAGRVPGHEKPGEQVEESAELAVTEGEPYVSRGGIKLANALDALGIDPAGRDCLDAGASTGGFTDCMLKRGAARVIALDVARGQLDWGLRNDPRVEVVEGRNAREIDPAELPFEPSLVTADLSFISLAKVLPALAACVPPGGELLALVKPQFEVGPERVGKGGVVRSAEDRREALRAVAEAVSGAGLTVRGFASSGLPGPKGNRETFIWASRGGEPVADLEVAIAEVEP